jgi:hypothetical protein
MSFYIYLILPIRCCDKRPSSILVGNAARQIIKVYPKEMIISKATGFQNYPVDSQPVRNGRLQYHIPL